MCPGGYVQGVSRGMCTHTQTQRHTPGPRGRHLPPNLRAVKIRSPMSSILGFLYDIQWVISLVEFPSDVVTLLLPDKLPNLPSVI